MAMRNFLLTLHIFGAIAGFGVNFAFPFIRSDGLEGGERPFFGSSA